MRALIITTVSGFVPQFEMNNVKILQELGYEIHYAANYNTPVYGSDNSRLDNTGIIRHQVDFVRSPFRVFQNVRALYQLVRIMKENKYQLVHCHTPMGGVLGRIAANLTRTAPVIYTAHGFHFYKGAPLLNWLVYYPVEKMLTGITDGLVTINREDKKRADLFSLRKRGRSWYVPGVGMKNRPMRKAEEYYDARSRLDILPGTMILTSVGELTKRKNQIQMIEAMKELRRRNIKYLICGSGQEELKYREIIDRDGLGEHVILMGYRTDVTDILNATDVFVFPSKQEGLPVALMEAMQIGLPVVCSDIRGNQDLIRNGYGGILVKNQNTKEYIKAISRLYTDKDMRRQMGKRNHLRIKSFLLEKVEERMKKMYEYYSGYNVNL